MTVILDKKEKKAQAFPLVRGHGDENGLFRIPFWGKSGVSSHELLLQFSPDRWAVMRGQLEKLQF